MVASRESAVRACPCPNSPSSAAWNSPEPASSRRCLPGPARAVAPAQQRGAGLALADLGQAGDRADPVVVDVPQPGEDPAGSRAPGRSRVSRGPGRTSAWPARRARRRRSHRAAASLPRFPAPNAPRASPAATPPAFAGPVPPRSPRRRGRPVSRSACRFPRRCRPPGPAGRPRPAPAPTGPRPRHSRGGAPRRRPRRRRTTSRAAAFPPPRPGARWGPLQSARSRQRAYSHLCLAS